MAGRKKVIIKAIPKRLLRKRRKMKGILRSMTSRNNIHSFKRSCLLVGGVTTGTGLGTGTYYGIFSPQLNQLPNVSEFGALYDQYRLNYAVYKIVWRSTSVLQSETTDRQLMGAPYCIWTLDRDDVSVPSSIDTIREYASAREHYFTAERRTLYIKFKPNILASNYQSALATTYSPSFGKFIDIADGGLTPHYGVKFALVQPNNGSPSTASLFDIYATFYFQMKNPR